MKYMFKFSAVVATFALFLQGCLKDNCTRTFTIYRPVYQSKQQVRNNIKSNTPRTIQHAGKITLLGSTIFLNEVDKGIHVIDNSNPSQPRNISFIEIPGNVDIAVKGNILYADLYNELVTLDVSNPLNVLVKKITVNAFPNRNYPGAFAADTSRYIVDWIAKDTTVETQCNNNQFFRTDRAFIASSAGANVLSATNINAAAANGINGSMARFALLNNYLYTVSNSDLKVFDISNVINPVQTNTISIGWGIETIYPFKNNLFIGSTTGMFIYGTQNPAAPNRLGAFAHAFACDPVIADDKYAYVTLRGGTNCRNANLNQLDVINVENLQTPFLLRSYTMSGPLGLAKDNDLLFVCDGKEGLRVFNASQPLDLKQIKQIKNIETYDVIAWNGHAIVVTKDALVQFDYSNANNIIETSRISITK
jgi:hypothetical protein